MARRRMFSQVVTESGRFWLLSHEAQLFYFRMGMIADDSGFADCFTLIRLLQAKDETVQELIDNRYIRPVPDNEFVYYIVDWPRNNYIQVDRRQPSYYSQYLESLRVYPDKMESRSHPRQNSTENR